MLTNEMFQKLGLRYVVFSDRGRLAGLCTKKDLWFVLNEGREGYTGGNGAGLTAQGGGWDGREGDDEQTDRGG